MGSPQLQFRECDSRKGNMEDIDRHFWHGRKHKSNEKRTHHDHADAVNTKSED